MWKVVRLKSGAYTCVNDNGKKVGLYARQKDADRARVSLTRQETTAQRGKRHG